MRRSLIVTAVVAVLVLVSIPAHAEPTPEGLDVVTAGEGIQVTVTMSDLEGVPVGETADHLDGYVGIYPVRQGEIDWGADFMAVSLYRASVYQFQATVQIGTGNWAVVVFPADRSLSSSVPAPVFITMEGFVWWPWLSMFVAIAAVVLWLNRGKLGKPSAPEIDASISGQLGQQGSTGKSVAGMTVSRGHLG